MQTHRFGILFFILFLLYVSVSALPQDGVLALFANPMNSIFWFILLDLGLGWGITYLFWNKHSCKEQLKHFRDSLRNAVACSKEARNGDARQRFSNPLKKTGQSCERGTLARFNS
jgi:hypothetical protein